MARESCLVLLLALSAFAQEVRPVSRVRVPATANPYLAGMPSGTRSSHGDAAPAQSPVLIRIPPGGLSVTFAAEGRVAHGPPGQHQPDPPSGSRPTRHDGGSENGLSNIQAPFNSLIGVFLSDSRPDLTKPPRELKLRGEPPTVAPQLQQLFYIGAGQTNSGARRRFLVPAGATRLFLGVMDGHEWSNNEGEFQVTVTLERTDVSSTISFADWECLPGRAQCTPAEARVTHAGGGRYRVLLPAHLAGASVPAAARDRVNIVSVQGIVCWNGRCEGPEKRRLHTVRSDSRVSISIEGPAGETVTQREGYFEIELVVSGERSN